MNQNRARTVLLFGSVLDGKRPITEVFQEPRAAAPGPIATTLSHPSEGAQEMPLTAGEIGPSPRDVAEPIMAETSLANLCQYR